MAMYSRAILFCWLSCSFVTASVAQQPRELVYLDGVPGARIDLDAVSGSGSRKIVFARVSFVEDDRSRCPEDSGSFEVFGGTFTQMRMALPTDIEGNGSSNGWRSTLIPLDDDTYQYRVALPACRTDVAMRQQIRRGGGWTSQLVRRELRPSVPVEERRELERQRLERDRQSCDGILARLGAACAEERARERQATEAVRLRDLHHEVSTTRQAFFFDEAPPVCFDATGEYRVIWIGVVFSFVTPDPPVVLSGSGGLPQDQNRFVIERADPDENHGRLYFTRGDCRFELTVSQSVLRDGQWVAVSLAPNPH
jgi:hypothetical protein